MPTIPANRPSPPAALRRSALNPPGRGRSMRFCAPAILRPRIETTAMNASARIAHTARILVAIFALAIRDGVGRGAPARGHPGRLGRGDHRIPTCQRASRAPLSRCQPRKDHGQPHVPRRLPLRELRRDRNGASARAHDVQGHADLGQPEGGDEQARHALQRVDVLRSHQLFRDVQRIVLRPRLGARDGSRSDGELEDGARSISTAK